MAGHEKAGKLEVDPNNETVVEPVEITIAFAHASLLGAGAPQSWAAKIAHS